MSPSGGVSDAPIETAPGSASRDNPRAAFAPNLRNISISLIDPRYFQADHVGHRVEHHFWCRLHLWLSLLLCMVGTWGYYGTCCWDPARGYGYRGYASANVYGRWSNCQRFHEGCLGQPAYRELWCRQSHYISNISPLLPAACSVIGAHRNSLQGTRPRPSPRSRTADD
jgi:hypothetical protein